MFIPLRYCIRGMHAFGQAANRLGVTASKYLHVRQEGIGPVAPLKSCPLQGESCAELFTTRGLRVVSKVCSLHFASIYPEMADGRFRTIADIGRHWRGMR